MRNPVRARLILPVALLFNAATLAQAGVAPDGFEFVVNTYTTGDQSRPIVASRVPEGFIVLWTSFGQLGPGNPNNDDLFAQLFDLEMVRVGSEFRINTATIGDQSEGRIGSNDSGEFVIAWTNWYQGDGSSQGVKARRYDSLGLPVGAEFQVNTYTTGAQYRPHVSMNASGDFVVVWADGTGLDGDGFGVFGQLFDSGGGAFGSEFQVNTWTTGAQSFPEVFLDDSGGFVVAWTDFAGEDGSGRGVFGQLFDSAGGMLGGELQINTYTTGDQSFEHVTGLPGGGFVVTWRDSSSLDGSGYGTFGRRYDSGGSPLGGAFQVNAYTTGDQRFSSVSADASGRFVVAWTSSGQDGDGYGIFAHRFSSTASPMGAEFRVNSYTTGNQRIPEVAMDDAGDFVVTWMDDDAVDGDGGSAVARRFFGRAPEVTSHQNGDPVDCSEPWVNRPTFTWDPDGYDRFKFFLGTNPGFVKGTATSSGDGWLKIPSWQPAKKKWRNICLKALASNPANPIMYLRVQGRDTSLPSNDPARTRFSGTIEAIPLP